MADLDNIQEIRLLPMDKNEEFPEEEEVREYLAVKLPEEEDGKYYYRERGIIIENYNALILFQYDASIIGYGVLTGVEKLNEQGEVHTEQVSEKMVPYNGYYQFIPSSIHNIEEISRDELQKIVGDIPLKNAKQHIDMKHYDSIREKLLEKQEEYEKDE